MSRDVIKTIKYKGHTIEIKQDDCNESPRDWDNLTEIHYHSSRYTLGDTNHTDMDEYNAMLREAKRQGDVVIPMFAYIHSGISLSLASFHGRLPQGHAQFDSGRAGTVIIRRKDILENWGGKRMTPKLREKAYEYAEGDIETLNQFFAGDVYGYVVDGDGDSCWGFYGMEDVTAEAKSAIDWQIKRQTKEHCEQLKKWIKNKVGIAYRYGLCTAFAPEV